MAILSPGDLLKQASRLILPPSAGPPLQVDIRRAVSSAYYSLFHSVLTAVADEFVGATYRSSKRYAHVYRCLDHSRLRKVCDDGGRARPAAKAEDDFAAYGFGKEVRDFATGANSLQERRNRADYNPGQRWKTEDARAAIDRARDAMQSFSQAAEDDRKALLTLLLCPGRRGG